MQNSRAEDLEGNAALKTTLNGFIKIYLLPTLPLVKDRKEQLKQKKNEVRLPASYVTTLQALQSAEFFPFVFLFFFSVGA